MSEQYVFVLRNYGMFTEDVRRINEIEKGTIDFGFVIFTKVKVITPVSARRLELYQVVFYRH